MRTCTLAIAIAGIILGTGCSESHLPAPYRSPSAAPATATPTPNPNATATPTPSGILGGATPTPTPSATPTAGASATPVPTSTATQSSSGLYVAAPFPNSFTQVTTTLTVPNDDPPQTGTVIEWPGLVPWNTGGNTTFSPIDAGVLRPVLTWGPSCAPGTQPTPYSTWFVSAEYYNDQGSVPGLTGCQGGPILAVSGGDPLLESLTLSGNVWTDTITDENTSQSVSFAINLQGSTQSLQTQNLLYFFIDGYGQSPADPAVFTGTTFTMANAPSDASACVLATVGTYDANDSQTAPTLSGNTCSIANITLYFPFPTTTPTNERLRRGPTRVPAFGLPPLPGQRSPR